MLIQSYTNVTNHSHTFALSRFFSPLISKSALLFLQGLLQPSKEKSTKLITATELGTQHCYWKFKHLPKQTWRKTFKWKASARFRPATLAIQVQHSYHWTMKEQLGSMNAIYKIISIVRAFWLVCKCVFIALWRKKTTKEIWLAVSKLWKYIVSWEKLKYTYARSISSSENNSFIKEIKHVLHALIASTASRVFTDLQSNSPKHSRQFSPSYEGTQSMLYFLSMTESSIDKPHKLTCFHSCGFIV